jgi:hypothetical protein
MVGCFRNCSGLTGNIVLKGSGVYGTFNYAVSGCDPASVTVYVSAGKKSSFQSATGNSGFIVKEVGDGGDVADWPDP